MIYTEPTWDRIDELEVGIATLRAQNKALMEENDDLHEQLSQKLVEQTFIENLAVKNGGLEIEARGAMMNIIADCFAQTIMESKAENYLEMSFHSKRFLPNEMLLLTLQKCTGKTPHQLRAEAEDKNKTLMEALGRIKKVLGPSAPTCDGCAVEIAEALKIIGEVER
jgi:hypothetical protein